MADVDDSGDTAPLGRIRYPDGRVAYGPKEREEAVKQRELINARKDKAQRVADENARHPQGLAQIKNTDGSIARKGGDKPWLRT